MLSIKSNKNDLLHPLQVVSGIVERKHTLPILSNVLIEKTENRINFLATDIEIQISTYVKCIDGNFDGAVTVNAKKLQDILRALPENNEIVLQLEDKRIQIRSGKGRFNLQTLPPEDFPHLSLSNVEPENLVISQQLFKQLLTRTQFSMAVQDVRYYLNGLLLLVEGNKLNAVTTDGHRLAYSGIKIEQKTSRQEIILPRKAVIELNRLLSDTEDNLSIKITPTQICFEFNDIILISKLIDGKFPDYQRVIPLSFKVSLLLNRELLFSALQRISILTNDKFRGVRVMLEKNCLRLNAANAEQEDAQEEIEINYQGENIDIGFNITYLIDVLNNITDKNILWNFNDAGSSTMISLENNEDFKYIVMPMRI